MDVPQPLPDDVLVHVLRGIAPRGLAACRCVCKAWRDVVDVRRLLRADLLPLSVGGIFINFIDLYCSEFFSRPSTRPTISGRFDYLPTWYRDPLSGDFPMVRDHCNGLLLLEEHVVNPATRQWDALPPRPPMFDENGRNFRWEEYLVFDPTVSLHYKVFIIPRNIGKTKPEELMNDKPGHKLDLATDKSEWPPSVWALYVFSTRSGSWKERFFIREGKAAGTVDDTRVWHYTDHIRYAAYCRGALYVHGETNFIVRISLSNNKYRVIKAPTVIRDDSQLNPRFDSLLDSRFYLGRSKHGVYVAKFSDQWSRHLHIWILKESCGQTEWILKHDSDLHHTIPRLDYYRRILGSWILQDINFPEVIKILGEDDDTIKILMKEKFELDSSKEEHVEGKFEWNSDKDDILDEEHIVKHDHGGYSLFHVEILGFHPYKEIVFLRVSSRRGLAYHWKDSKVQDLGYLYPISNDIHSPNDQAMTESFPYTPCWMGELSGKEDEKCEKTS